MTQEKDAAFVLRGEYITLDALLKAAGIASTGGEAKVLIQEGKVRVDGEPESRRGRKLRGGECVEALGKRIRVEATETHNPKEA
ncbi:RNA-binding S4 domain-containing protein [Sutterella faecalis]|uniref:RNA-binding S4 domain-containing protein n=2 Tax=Sutterella TaxID=40544 RepID=A0AAI9SCY1_9BURK|nr:MULTISPECIES: RNA-binding S4 domain-containing protein [Sutterella]KAB7652000.1 RNA-binding S4 domain-containing protein [Sutterella seckii]MBE5692800.1 RNA-binding S4 domain-containing protein [Sutterella sp.]QDA54676.1 RNA-binding S4 domain-containing protein [Sutterella faecalis]